MKKGISLSLCIMAMFIASCSGSYSNVGLTFLGAVSDDDKNLSKELMSEDVNDGLWGSNDDKSLKERQNEFLDDISYYEEELEGRFENFKFRYGYKWDKEDAQAFYSFGDNTTDLIALFFNLEDGKWLVDDFSTYDVDYLIKDYRSSKEGLLEYLREGKSDKDIIASKKKDVKNAKGLLTSIDDFLTEVQRQEIKEIDTIK